MEGLVERLAVGGVITFLSFVFCCLPLFLKLRNLEEPTTAHTEESFKKIKKKKKNVIMAFLLNLGGGVLIANCFCHWLPEVREALDKTDLQTELPVAEMIVCSGLLAIALVEEILHHFIHPHREEKTSKKRPIQATTDSETEFYDVEKSNRQRFKDPAMIDDEAYIQQRSSQVKEALRTFFVISALSFHSVLEGMALVLGDETSGLWINFGAIALHKFAIAFSLGVELIAVKATTLQLAISITVFSVSPAVGVAISLVVDYLSVQGHINDLPLQVLQAVAIGTVIYVVFFEILPKAKKTGGTGLQHVLSLILGFLIFIPSLYFHGHDHDHEESENSTRIMVNGLNF